MSQVLERLETLFCPKDDAGIINEMDKANVRNVNNISVTVIAYEILTLIFVIPGIVKVNDVKTTSLSLIFIICFSLFFYIYSHRAKYYETISHNKITFIIIIAFSVLTIYSIYLAYDHYRYGKDIITFYIVMVTYSAFIIIKPYISVILLSASFTVCYCVLVSVDGAESIHIMNFFALACICIVASAAKYHLMRKQQLSKHEVIMLNEALEMAVRYDSLTKLKNRYALIEDSVSYLNKPVYIVMCDCDNFKNINDTYGHIMGDKVLVAISDVFKAYLPKGCIYRYGGDEFLIVNIGLEKENFDELKRVIHKSLDSMRIDGIDEKPTCSFGSVKGIAQSGAEFEELIQQADRNMYKEKQLKKTN